MDLSYDLVDNSYREELSRSNKSLTVSPLLNTPEVIDIQLFWNNIQITTTIKEVIVSGKWSQTITNKCHISRSNMRICSEDV